MSQSEVGLATQAHQLHEQLLGLVRQAAFYSYQMGAILKKIRDEEA